MSSDLDIRGTLRQAADAAEAPLIDQAGFGRRVRRHRNRRRAGIATMASAAVATVALVAPLAASQIGSDAGSSEAPVVGAPEPLPPVYFTLAGRAVMLDSDGTLHRLGVRAEAIVGPTMEGVLVSDGTSRLVHVRTPDSGAEKAQRTELPIGPVQSAAVSADGRLVAVIDVNDDVVVYDLVSGDELSRSPNDWSAYVADFSDRVLYAVGDDSLRLGGEDDAIDVPVDDGPARESAVGENVVAVTESNGTTRIYDVSRLPTPVKIAEFPGAGDLSPNGGYFLATAEEGATVPWDRDTGDLQSLTGLEGGVEQVRWLDDHTALVATGMLRAGKQARLLYGCAAATLECHEIFDAGTKAIRLLR